MEAPRGPPPKPARRTQREALSDAPTDQPPPRPRPQLKDRAAAAAAPVPSSQDRSNQSGGDSVIQPLDLGRENEGIPHGWSPAYWRYVTRPNKLQRSRERLRNVTAYYRISKIYDIGLMLCLLLLVICVILAGVFRP